MCSCASTCPAQPSQHNSPPLHQPWCLQDARPEANTRAAEVLRGSFRASAESPRPLPPRALPRGPLGSRSVQGEVGCAGPRRAPGMGPRASQAAPLAAAPFPEGRRSSPAALHARLARRLAAPGRPALGPALHHGSAGRCRRKCRSPPAPGLPSPPFPRGNLLARLGQANQTATPGAISPEECFDPAFSPRRRGQITMTNAGDPSRSLGQRRHRLI